MMKPVLATLAILLPLNSALAQSAPDTTTQEIMIKTTLMSFNDANLTGDYSVFHARLAKPFRDQFSPEKLKATFKTFVDQEVDISSVVAKTPISDGEVKVDDNGVLKINGHFDTQPSQIVYTLKYIRSDGDWKTVGIDVNIGKSPVKETPAPAPATSGSGKIQSGK
jgi:hypothetical protein